MMKVRLSVGRVVVPWKLISNHQGATGQQGANAISGTCHCTMEEQFTNGNDIDNSPIIGIHQSYYIDMLASWQVCDALLVLSIKSDQ